MDKRQKEELSRLGVEGVRFDCSMAQHTTFGVGGPAECLYEAKDEGNLRRVIAFLNREEIPYLVVGRGSNLLVKDEGLEGVVILLRGPLAGMVQEKTDPSVSNLRAHDMTVHAGAGLPIVDLLIHCRDSGYGGLEFLAGIPGTVGGAVAMNAGAFGKEIGDWVKEITVITAGGEVVARNRSQLKFSYRALHMEKNSVIIGACLKVDTGDVKTVAKRIAGYLKRRKENQPIGYPSAGSVFKNPPNDYAGRLIELAGLKGKKIGGAMISEKHANYIVNTGDATAKDILELLSMTQKKVRKETGVKLEPEIKVVGR
jgi:UDP-N-acetylmuramate dehydrogenase